MLPFNFVTTVSAQGAAEDEGQIKVPTVKSGGFNEWFNSLSVDELDSMWRINQQEKLLKGNYVHREECMNGI